MVTVVTSAVSACVKTFAESQSKVRVPEVKLAATCLSMIGPVKVTLLKITGSVVFKS